MSNHLEMARAQPLSPAKSGFVNLRRMNWQELVDYAEELQEELRQTKAMLAPVATLPAKLGLTRSEERLVGCLLKSAPHWVQKDVLHAAMYVGRTPETNPKIVDVTVAKTRPKLAPFGLEIGTVWGGGYFMPELTAVKLRGGAP